MPNNHISRPSRSRVPSAIGMGLVALDLVIAPEEETPPATYAGGTCGNVLIALKFLGWSTFPISRLGRDKAAERIIADLHKWKVSTDFVTRQPDGSTPVIVQRIRRLANGTPLHSFSWRCPGCGAHLPGYKPILASMVKEIALRLKGSQVFFFDRVSRSTLMMANISRKRGAVVMFEPTGIGDPALFREAWGVAHIVKYAHERLCDLAEIELPDSIRDSVLLEIETCGADGLRFQSRLPRARSDGWLSVPTFSAPRLKDTAGAGDWCTAGILHVLAQNGSAGLKRITTGKVQRAMEYGQALAVWNCGFEGARGGMYQEDRSQFEAAVDGILKGGDRLTNEGQHEKRLSRRYLPELCRACHEIWCPETTAPTETRKKPRMSS